MRKIFKANQIRDQTLKMFDRALNWDLFSTKQYIRRTGGCKLLYTFVQNAIADGFISD